jgi:hypothetical protein
MTDNESKKKPEKKVEYNAVCLDCYNDCKQFAFVTLMKCKIKRPKPKQTLL